MISNEFSRIDWAVLGGYLVIVLGIGFIASTRVKNTENYFLGGRRFGKLIMIGQSFGTGTHAEMPVSLAGIVYSSGLPGIWFQWKNMFVTPFYWLLAPLFRRFRRTTLAEVVEDRYGRGMGAFYAIFALLFFTINLASMLKGAGKVIVQATGTNLSVDVIVIGMTCIFIVYSFVGGLLATAWNDVVQGFLIIALSFMLVPRGWSVVGGLEGMRSTLGPEFFSLVAPGKYGLGFISVLTLNGLIGIIAQPQMIAVVGTGKDEMTCRVGHLYGTIVKRLCTVGWAVVGLIVAAMIAKGVTGETKLGDPEEAFGFACRHLLFPGGIGLLVASLLATNMAGCSAFMVTSGALMTNGIYRKYVKSDASDRHYLWVGRLSGLLVTIIAVLYAVFLIKRVLYSFLLTETMATYVGVSIFAGIIWRRANRWGASASIAAAITANFVGYTYTGERFDHWDPSIFLFSLGAGIAALVIVSLLTRPEPAFALEKFYDNLETPSDFDDADDEHQTRQTTAAEGRQLLIVNLLRLRSGAAGHSLFRAYRVDLIGFAVGWAVVLSVVAVVWFLLVR